MGKTLATLYPAIKALPLIADGKIFYVTAKDTGTTRSTRRAAKAERVRGASSQCQFNGQGQDMFCPGFFRLPIGQPARFEQGYYDRYKPAMRELFGYSAT